MWTGVLPVACPLHSCRDAPGEGQGECAECCPGSRCPGHTQPPQALLELTAGSTLVPPGGLSLSPGSALNDQTHTACGDTLSSWPAFLLRCHLKGSRICCPQIGLFGKRIVLSLFFMNSRHRRSSEKENLPFGEGWASTPVGKCQFISVLCAMKRG